MPIFKGDNWQHLYKGDGHPAALYKGSKKLAGWTEESQAGVSHAYFDDTYNDKADVVIHGKSTQVVTTGAQLFNKDAEIYSQFGGTSATPTETGITVTGPWYVAYELSLPQNANIHVSFQASGNTREIAFYKNKSFTETNRIVTIGTIGQGMFNTEDFEGIIALFYAGNGTSGTTTYTNVMFNLGTAALPWEPYTGGAPSPSPDYPQEITSVGDSGSVEVVSTGENLFNKDAEIYSQFGGTSATPTETGITVTGPWYVAYELSLPQNANIHVSFQASGNTREIAFYKNKSFTETNRIVTIGTIGQGMFNTEDFEGIIALFYAGNGTSGTTTYTNVMFNLGTAALPWEPYVSSTATFSTPNGLPGIPVDSGGNYTDADGQQWICDEIDTKKGVYRQNVKKVTYTGDNDEYWTRYNVTQYAGFSTDAADKKIASFSPGFSNRFPIDLNITNKRPGIWLGSTDSTDPSTRITFHNCNPSIASSLEEWRTWLSTHPVTLIYPLATPVETPLSDAVDTFLGGTNLFISEHEMDVTVKTEDQANPTGA